jgi:uncharacterized protein (DUF362 family)
MFRGDGGRCALSRRAFLRGMAALGAASAAGPLLAACARDSGEETSPTGIPTTAATATAESEARMSKISFVKAQTRQDGVRRAVNLLKPNGLSGSRVLVKPNFNTADPSPASTHPDTLRAVIEVVKDSGATQITLGERSGFGDQGRQPAKQIMAALGIHEMAREMGFDTLDFDDLDMDGWRKVDFEGSHWPEGFYVPRLLSEVDAVVSTCNLKTHFLGHFTLSLKLAVGFVPIQLPGQSHNYMGDLHSGPGGQSPNLRYMVAEINTAYEPKLIVMDGLVAFTTGGPYEGTRVDTQVFLAGTDRVAMDAVGVALLRRWGTTPEVSQGRIFQQEQIARAVELGLGVGSPLDIELVTDDEESETYAAEIRTILDQG